MYMKLDWWHPKDVLHEKLGHRMQNYPLFSRIELLLRKILILAPRLGMLSK
jgi:hypothetical protein